VLNAANEAAVGRFLRGDLGFLDIPRACRSVLAAHAFAAEPTLEELMAADRWARQEVARWKPLPHLTPTR
jgi:1-deoxy-D-xylulose-5-phosphate reductoisomerase